MNPLGRELLKREKKELAESVKKLREELAWVVVAGTSGTPGYAPAVIDRATQTALTLDATLALLDRIIERLS